jgi:hypothetical protein
MCRVEFDQFTIALLVRPDDAPDLTAEQAAALQDAHMAHLSGRAHRGAAAGG